MNIRIAGTTNDSIVDGPGLRYAIFTQGCPHHCPGCHNPKTHDFEGGKMEDTQEIIGRMLKNPLLSGITLSGGEPLMQSEPCLELARAAHAHGLNVWMYTGFVWENRGGRGGHAADPVSGLRERALPAGAPGCQGLQDPRVLQAVPEIRRNEY